MEDLSSNCACGDRFTVNHAPSCKKGAFVAQRHDGIRNLLTSLLSKVCKNVEVESHLLPIDNEVFDPRSTVTSPEASLDIKAGLFWTREVTAFFNVRVIHVNSACNQNKSTESIFKEHEKEKKRKYQQKIIDVEMRSFTPPPPPGFWHERRNGERMQFFSWVTQRTNSPVRMANLMPVPYLGLEHAYRLIF